MLKLEVIEEGLLNAVVFWFDLHLDDCETLTNGKQASREVIVGRRAGRWAGKEGLLNVSVVFWFDLHLDDCETLTNGE